ncbi:DUF3313 domain-containing protein [Parahaliea maris]|uniref:DUF3313 domain-containing protein n=1 Tax=Parahaliea maris TaxID=2716870 RepID=A0A5C8ZW72_9GAMM|nr:DUF3313 family protein [Parahaliea maris]TXS92805.1 DUF3313 domain-containing protein [Parahaliea maris]
MDRFIALATTVASGLLLTACASMAPAPPAETPDGLQLVPDTVFAEVYRKPGVDLTAYSTYGVTPCEVEFRKNWMRDQNSNRVSLSNRVTQKDVDRIKDALGAHCEAMFREALAQEPAYNVVEEFTPGEMVLVLRPAIVNLDINAPDVRSAGMSRTYTTSAGEMTLMLEAVDANTGDVLVRVLDRQRDFDDSYMSWSNSVTNKVEADRILRRWAGELRDGLDKVRAGG